MRRFGIYTEQFGLEGLQVFMAMLFQGGVCYLTIFPSHALDGSKLQTQPHENLRLSSKIGPAICYTITISEYFCWVRCIDILPILNSSALYIWTLAHL